MHELCRFLAAAAWALVNDDYRRASQGIACREVFGKIWACIFHDTACQGVIHMQEKILSEEEEYTESRRRSVSFFACRGSLRSGSRSSWSLDIHGTNLIRRLQLSPVTHATFTWEPPFPRQKRRFVLHHTNPSYRVSQVASQTSLRKCEYIYISWPCNKFTHNFLTCTTQILMQQWSS